jgi:hypothetical protein
LDRLVIELVGDLAAYRPGAKIVVFEGDSDFGFDIRMTCTLFPQFQATTNPISGGNKRLVTELYELLEAASVKGHLPGQFYAITDSDDELSRRRSVPRKHAWNTYHIENYLLEPQYILRVLGDLNRAVGSVESIGGIESALKDCARATADQLIAHKLRKQLNHELMSSLDLSFDSGRRDIVAAFGEALRRCESRVAEVTQQALSNTGLKILERKLRNSTIRELHTGAWRRTYRGRDVLRRFVGAHAGGIAYEAFRDLIVARMRDAEFQPPGMKTVVDAILADQGRRGVAAAQNRTPQHGRGKHASRRAKR